VAAVVAGSYRLRLTLASRSSVVFVTVKTCFKTLSRHLSLINESFTQITAYHGNRYQKKKVVPDENNQKITLEKAGISRKLSSEAQQIALRLRSAPFFNDIFSS
jgi:hypothetical protein